MAALDQSTPAALRNEAIAVVELEPDRHADDAEFVGTVYSNFDHELIAAAAEAIRRTPGGCGQHAAWEFCGYVEFGDGVWVETVWRFHAPIARYAHPDLQTLIDYVNAEHGDD